MRFLPLVLLLPFLTVACTMEPSYPDELSMADSLMQRGSYTAADSLLACYDSKTAAAASDAESAYRNLLRLQRLFVSEKLTENDFFTADSLYRYYDTKDYADKKAKASLVLGGVYRAIGDYPSALHYYLQASQLSASRLSLAVQGWACRSLGDVYFEQRMFEECMPFYRQYYNLSVASRDTLRMAYSSFSMGQVFTILDQPDSTVFYYKKSISLEMQQQEKDAQFLADAKSYLADIYIQTEQYEEAAALMSRDSLDMQNWAYWHLGQHHLDSAVYYFQGILDQHGWVGRVWYLRELALLEEERGNLHKSNVYFKECVQAEDSLKLYSKENEMRRINAQYNYNRIKQERDEEVRYRHNLEQLLFTVVFVFAFLTLLAIRFIQQLHQKKNDEIEQERRRYKNEKEQYEKQISSLQAENRHARIIQESHHELERDNHELYNRIVSNAEHEGFYLTEDEWHQLAKAIDQDDNNFTTRLLALNNKLSEYELRVCYLLKLDISSVNIARMLFKTDKAIYMTRQRLYPKLTGEQGTSRQLKSFIKNF